MKKDFVNGLLISMLAIALAGLTGCSTAETENSDEVAEELAGTETDADAEEFGAEEEQAAGDEESMIDEAEKSSEPQTAENQEKAAEEALNEEVLEEEVQKEEAIVEPAPPEEPVAGPEAPANRITAINYLASPSGGTIEIRTDSPAIFKTRANAGNNQYVIEVENAALADSLKRPYIMKDFEGPFGAINAYQNQGGKMARIVVQMKGAGEPVVTQEGTTLLVTAPGSSGPEEATKNLADAKANPDAPAEGMEEEAAGDIESYDVKQARQTEKILAARTLDEFLMGSGQFFGRPISIQTNDADIRDIISFIAEESGVNIVISDDVDGKVSVKLRQVPWDQALVIVMRSKNLGYVRQGNVLRITRLATLQLEANAAKEIVEAQKKLTPLKVKVIPVSYASVSDLQNQIKPFLTTDRGQVVSDSRTSSIIITDTADVLARVERLVRELDIPPAQVMIEGKIVEASETFTRRMGVNWSLSGAPVEVASSGGFSDTAIRLTNRLSVTPLAQTQLQAQNAFMNLHVGTLDFLGDLDATLSLAQSDSLVRIISSPRVVTMNKEKSEISQKSEVISINSTLGQDNIRSTTPQRTPVELRLTVTPQITAEGSVVLDVDVLRQFAGAEVDPDTKARPINSRAAKTKVLVPNGQTAVIGGIYQSDETESETGVPGLKDLPVVGWLFKQKSSERLKNELLLFLTPRILNAQDQKAAQ